MGEKKLVPKLRFPEFTDNWKFKELKGIAKRITQRNSENALSRVLTNSAADGVIDQRDFFKKDIANHKNLENYFIVKKGDYVYNPRISSIAPVGPISKNKVGDGVMSPLYTVFHFNNSNNDFYEFYYQSSFWHSYLKDISNKGARHDRMSIKSSDFMKMPLPYPSSDEQRKIADCLSSIDELISLNTQKLNALKDYKIGLMQMLFPAEGEKVPKVRFPEFRDDGEWKEKYLHKIFSLQQGYAFSSKDGTSKGVRWLKIADVGIQKMSHESPSFLPFEYESEYSKFTVNRGDYVIALTRPILNGKLKIAEVDSVFDKALLNQRVGKLQSIHNLGFIYFLLQTTCIVNNIARNIAGNDPPNFSMQQIESIKVYMPGQEEQNRIYSTLSSLDDKIALENKNVELLKLQKKGLVESLFASL